MVKLYPDQEDIINKAREALTKHKRIIVCAVTGSGKSIVFLEIARSAISKGSTVLIISESRKIFSQIHEYQKDSVLINADTNPYLIIRCRRIYLSMAQTLRRRTNMLDQFSRIETPLIVIIDEAHINQSSRIIEQLPDAIILGFTATPDGRKAEHIPKLYEHVIEGLQPQELVDLGRLASYRHLGRIPKDLDKLKIEKGEYSEDSQMEVFGKRYLFENLVDDLSNFLYKKCIIFCSSIKHAQQTYDQLCIKDIKASIVHSQLSRESFHTNLNLFTKGDVGICVSVGIFSKGFDFPAIDLVVLYRKTTSLSCYLQMCGRGSRICEGKQGFTVLDYGMNIMQHGPWNMTRDWKMLAFPPPKKDFEEQPPAIKECPQCQSLITSSLRKCPFCGYEFRYEEEKRSAAPK